MYNNGHLLHSYQNIHITHYTCIVYRTNTVWASIQNYICLSHNFANLHSKTNLSFFGSHKYNFQILNVINIIEFLICLSKMCAVGATKTKNRAKITPVCRLQFKLYVQPVCFTRSQFILVVYIFFLKTQSNVYINCKAWSTSPQ